MCTTFQHHVRKVLKLSVNPVHPDTFMSCSADGTIRLFDIRGHYSNARTSRFDKRCNVTSSCVPQALGGGRANQPADTDKFNQSLILDYSKMNTGSRRRLGTPTLYSVDVHPNGHNFIVGSELGDVRLFDLRKVDANDPSSSTVNTYKGSKINPNAGCEVTGCAFSHDGREIVSTHLCQHIYLFDTDGHYDNTETRQEQEPPPQEQENDEIRVPVASLYDLFLSQNEESNPNDDDNDDITQDEPVDGDDVMIDDTSYKQVYTGHISRETIKGVSFLGPTSDYIASGSDDNRIFIWHKTSAKLCAILEGHENTVNTVVGHPTAPILASGGIDSVVKLWGMEGDALTARDKEKKEKHIARIQQKNKKKPVEREVNTRDMMYMIQVLRQIMAHRGGNIDVNFNEM
jgi:WD40 repeat protein